MKYINIDINILTLNSIKISNPLVLLSLLVNCSANVNILLIAGSFVELLNSDKTLFKILLILFSDSLAAEFPGSLVVELGVGSLAAGFVIGSVAAELVDSVLVRISYLHTGQCTLVVNHLEIEFLQNICPQ